MIKYFFGLLLIPTFATSVAFADYSNCRWTMEGTNSTFASESLYEKPPKLIAAAAGCSDPTPTCTGQLYCESSSRFTPPKVVTVGCLAVKVNNKWSCPDATTCIADQKVIVEGLLQVPAPAQAAPSKRQNSGGGGGMDGTNSGQGGGGR